MNLTGEKQYEKRGALEEVFAVFSVFLLLDWLAGFLGQGADSFAVKESPLGLATFGTLSKNFGGRNRGPMENVPLFLLPLLGMVPVTPNGLSIADQIQMLYDGPPDENPSAQTSFFNFFNVGETGGTSASLANALFYGVIAASVADLLTPDRGFAAGGHLSAENTGMAIGPSHQSGMLGVTRKGSPFLFEGGEYIINKDSAQKLGKSKLDSLNSYGRGGALPEFGNSTEYVDYGPISSFLDEAIAVLTFENRRVDKQNRDYDQGLPSMSEGFKYLGYLLGIIETVALASGQSGLIFNRGEGGGIPEYAIGGHNLGMVGLAGFAGFLGLNTIIEALTDDPIPLDVMNTPGGIEILGPSLSLIHISEPTRPY